MSDIFLQRIYNDVKDDSWPSIENYCDYVKLPNYIKEECTNRHNLHHHYSKLTDGDEFRKSYCDVGYRFEKLVYVPVYKCASSYYENLFGNKLGWEKISLAQLDHSHKMFGLIMHPLTRFLKGTTQWIWQSYHDTNSLDQLEQDLNSAHFEKLFGGSVLGDFHTTPYSIHFGKTLNCINWIPYDILTAQEIRDCMQRFIGKHNSNITLPTNIKPLNQSTGIKLKLYNTIKNIWQKHNVSPESLDLVDYQYDGQNCNLVYQLYIDDLKFFHKLIDNFDPTWQTTHI